jgi:hypothetical protein
MGPAVFGTNWSLARRIPVTLSGAYWLVPGNGHLCVISQGSTGTRGVSVTCATVSQAVHAGIAAITVSPPGSVSHISPTRLIVGVAPDGAHEVVVHTRDSDESAPVVNHVFVLRDAIAGPPDSYTAQ